MPRTVISDAKGVVNSAGSGTTISNAVTLSGATTLSGAVTLGAALVGSVDTRTDAGAVSLTSVVTLVATTTASALTLAAGTAGQIKILSMTTNGGDATLTPAGGILSPSAGLLTTITFNSVGDAVILVYTGAKWAIVSNYGCALA